MTTSYPSAIMNDEPSVPLTKPESTWAHPSAALADDADVVLESAAFPYELEPNHVITTEPAA